MARAGRTRSLRDLRAEADAVEARQRDESKDRGDEAAPADASGEAPAAKPKKAKKATGEKKSRAKTAKQVRKRIVWVVYDNGHKPIAKFPFTEKKAAEDKAEQMKTEKKTTY